MVIILYDSSPIYPIEYITYPMNVSKTGRNDPCPCGSGKKHKQCCMGKSNLGSSSKSTSSLSTKSKISNALKVAASNFDAGKMQDAIVICQQILQLDPNNDEALNLLGILAYYAGNNDVAINLLTKAITVNPKYADAHNNLGEIFRTSGSLTKAVSHFKEALKLKPDYIDALINYGNALQDIYQYEQAIAIYQRVLKLNAKHAGALSNIANALQQLNRHESAIKIFQQLLMVDEDYEWALGGLLYSKLHCCIWDDVVTDIAKIEQKIGSGKCVIKPFEFLPISNSSKLQLLCARLFTHHQYPSRINQSLAIQYSCEDKIRIAYLSADFRKHAVSQLLVEVLEKHDKSKFEVIGISFGEDDSSQIRNRVVTAFDQFFDVRHQSDEDVAALLRSLNVHIAIDLMGFTTNARTGIFSYRAAPIQIGFLGYAGTSGADYFDYIIADDVVIPSEQAEFYSEKIISLPNTFFPHDSQLPIAKNIPSRQEVGLPEGVVVFCAFNNQYKITSQLFDIWMRLLSKVEGSVLWLAKANDIVKKNLWAEAANRGIPADRIIFAERTEHLEDHLARYQLADLFLDTLPYNAHTTASDALWAGLPVITCMGNAFAGRVAASLLIAAGLPELVTYSLGEYESLALRLASDRAYLEAIKSKVRENRHTHPIFDTAKYVKNLELALAKVLNKSLAKASRAIA